jgi:hypothetical protein
MMDDFAAVIYAYTKNDDLPPWIYGIYEDHLEAFDKMEEMQNSAEYGHLIWSHNLLPINKKKNAT